MPCSQMDSVWLGFNYSEVVLLTMGHMGSAWCFVCAEGHYEICNAIMQPLQDINVNEKGQEVNFAF